MGSKKSADDSPPDKEAQEMREIEEKVKRMLDPSEPDPEPEIPEELPAEIKIEPVAGEQPATAPVVKKDKSKGKTPVAVEVKGEEEAEETVDVAKKEPTANETTVIPATDETDVQSEEPKEEPSEENIETESEEQTKPEETTETTTPPEPESESEIEDPETTKAVEEIIKQESDQILAHEDEQIAKVTETKKIPFKSRIKNVFKAWWQNPAARKATIIAVIIGVAAALVVPNSRYFVLNTLGVRSSASVKVLDESTRQPLKNVSVSLLGQTASTDDEGVARINKVKLGRAELMIKKRAFAPVRRQITIGWGSNPLGDASLEPVGSQYAFSVSDYLSGKPIKKVEAVSGEASAYSDEEGKIKLTIDKTDDSPVEVMIVGEGLRVEKLTIGADDKTEHALPMVPGRKHAFITKRSGKYDVYKIDIDGKNEGLVLAGTGSERDDMALVPHPTKELVALVSTRGNSRNSDGYLMSKLTLIDLSDNSTVEVAQSERVQVVDWVGDKLVYVRITEGTSGANPKRHRLMSYDQDTYESKEIAASNFFNDVLVARGAVYYSPSNAYQNGEVGLFRANADGSNKRSVMAQETWSIFRTSYDMLTLAIGQDWYEYNLGSNSSNKLGGEPPSPKTRSYIDSPDGKHSLWVDKRDGKGVLLAYDIGKNEDKEIYNRSGLKLPIRWLNNKSVVLRIDTEQETADYALSLDGGEPKKIRDVTNTAGIEDWYYY